MFLEAQDNGLMLRTINLSGTAIGSFIFYKDFFEEFDKSLSVPSSDQNDSKYENCCQISMKACLGIFKNMRQVVRCVLRIDTKTSRLIVKLFCRMDTVKTHQISIVDVDSEMPSFNTVDLPNNVTASHKVLAEVITYFQMGEEEITFDAEEDTIKIRNFVEGAKENESALRTQLKLKAGEFDKYSIEEKTSVTFNMKELKAFLLFAEAANLDVDIRFEDTGKPIAFIANNFNMFEEKLVMSTLAPDDVSMYEDYEQNKSEVSFTAEHSKRRSSSTTDTNTMKKRKEDIEMDEESVSAQDVRDLTTAENSLSEKSKANNDNDVNQSFHPVRPSILPEINVSSKEANVHPMIPPVSSLQCDPNFSLTFKDTEELECIQQSPENRRIRNIFNRCFEKTYVPKEPSPDSYYVPDSDEE